MTIGWDNKHGGFFYNLDWDDKPDMRHKLWWPASEGAAAAAFLMEHIDDPFYESWYRNIWDVIARHHIDEVNGAWHEQLTEDMKPAYSLFAGKGDIYHALQACLIPLFPATGSITKGIIALVLKTVQDRTAQEVATADIEGALTPFDLKNQLSSNRTQGIPNMIALIRETAARYL